MEKLISTNLHKSHTDLSLSLSCPMDGLEILSLGGWKLIPNDLRIVIFLGSPNEDEWLAGSETRAGRGTQQEGTQDGRTERQMELNGSPFY